MKRITLYMLSVLLLMGCSKYDLEGFVTSSSARVDVRFEQSMLYNQSQGETHLTTSEGYAVYVCSDSHLTTDSQYVAAFARAYKSDTTCRIAIHLGDLITGQNHYQPFFEAMATVPTGYRVGKDTVFYTIGNHDLFFNQWEFYKQYVPTTFYWFDTHTEAGKKLDLFVCIDTGEGTVGRKGIQWLRDVLESKSQEGYRHIIVFTHTHFFGSSGNQALTSGLALEEVHELTGMFQTNGVTEVWSGHVHKRSHEQMGNVQYYTWSALQPQGDGKSVYEVVTMGTEIAHQCVIR